MFSDLLLTRDKHNTLIGGGYTLNSSFLNSGIPAFTHAHAKSGGGGGSKGKHNTANANAESNSGSDSESEAHANTIPAKVSDIFERANGKNALVIPAGIFMIHSTSSVDSAPGSVPMKTKLKELLYYGSENSENSDNSDGSNESDNSDTETQTQVVPDDLYEKLLGLVSPSHANRYWDPKSTTRKRRIGSRKARSRRQRQ